MDLLLRKEVFFVKFPIFFPILYLILLYSFPSFETYLIFLILLILAETHFGATWPFFIDKVNNDIELCNLYNSADSLVLPSINDNTPLISQEAQMCGLPIISFDHNGISEIVNHKVTGYKAKSLDINSLKDGIDWVFQNLNHANLIKNSLQMSRNIKLKFIGNEYKKLYKNILNN